MSAESVNETATGSANSWSGHRCRILSVHLRSPSVAAGVSSFLWALAFGLCVWLFLLGIGSSRAMAVLVGLLTLCASFLYIRTSGRQGRLRTKR